MIYKFSELYNKRIFAETRVMVITGGYSIFNNIVADQLKEMAKGSEDGDLEEARLIMSEFIESSDKGNGELELSFDDFLETCSVPPVSGKWFCKVDYDTLTEKQLKRFNEYIKEPSEFGILVIEATEWKTFRVLLKNRVLTGSKVSHLIQLSYPSRGMLKEIVKRLFNSREVSVDEKAIDLFIMRMSIAYDDYITTIDDICDMNGKFEVSYEKMKVYLKNINNYVLDDFLSQLLVPIKNKKVSSRRKIYKMYGFLREDMTAKSIVNKLKYKVEDMLELRMAINEGKIPVLVKYGVNEVKARLPEDSRLQKMSAFTFKRSAYLASKTTLRDWYYIKVMLNSAKGRDDSEYDRILIDIIHRGVFNCDRLTNIMGISNVLEESLYRLNGVFFNPYIKKKEGIMVGDTLIDFETGEILDESDEDVKNDEIKESLTDNTGVAHKKKEDVSMNKKSVKIDLTAVMVDCGIIQVIGENGNMEYYAQRGIHRLTDAEKDIAMRNKVIDKRAFNLKELPAKYRIEFECPEIQGRAVASFNRNKLKGLR